MEYDEYGFKYPIVDYKKCVECGLCSLACPSIYKNKSINKAYVCFSKDEKSRLTSSSGVIFEILSRYILNKKGVVIRAAFDENNNLNHIIVDNIYELEKVKGSKYLQSNLESIFKNIKILLKDTKVLFVGTPCQVAGLKSY